MTLFSTAGFAVCILLLTLFVHKEIRRMSDSVNALVAAFTAYKTTVDAKLANVAQQVTDAVAAAQAEDKTAVDALTAQIQAATTALG